MFSKRVIQFLGLAFGLSAIVWVLMGTGVAAEQIGSLYVIILMWCPGIAAIIITKRTDGNLHALGWKPGKAIYQLESYLLPMIYAGIAYGIAYAAGWARFTGEATEGMPLLSYILYSVGPLLIIGGMFPALGEEIGWRGLLVPELRKSMGFIQAALLSGLIWAIWHYPLFLIGKYTGDTPLLFRLLCFTVMVAGISVPFAWLRERSGSLWTAVILHASHNIIIQQVFDVLTGDTGITEYITGEFGAALAVMAVIVALFYWWRSQHTKQSA